MRFPPKESERGGVVDKRAAPCAGCCRKRKKNANAGGCAEGGSEKTQLLKKQWQIATTHHGIQQTPKPYEKVPENQ